MYKLSFRNSILLVIIGMGMLGMVTVASSGYKFIELSYENEKLSINEILHIKVTEHLKELRKYSRELSDFVQKEKGFVTAVTERNTERLINILDDQFYQYYTTANILKLDKLIVLDAEYTPIVSSDEGYPVGDGLICENIIQESRGRQRSERLRVKSGLCQYQGRSFFGLLAPVGGFKLKGYLLVVTDPVHSLKHIEGEIGNPVMIREPNGEERFRSVSWPLNELQDKYLIVSHEHRVQYSLGSTNASEHDRSSFTLAIARDKSWFEKKVEQTVNYSVMSAMLIMSLGLVFSAFIVHLALRPIHQLQDSSKKLGDGNYEPVRDPHFPELHDVVSTFNFMAKKVSVLISDLKQARTEADSANNIKSQFLANMSHEIRTPLTAIIGYAEALLDPEITRKDQSHATATIIRSGEHLREIINDILDLSKIEANKLEIEKRDVFPLSILQDVCAVFGKQAREKGIAFDIRVKGEVPDRFTNDPVRVKQVLLNLCSNAIKFTNAGEVYVDVSYDKERQHFCFECIDSGIGMNDAELERIFLPFMQASSSTTRDYGGTGLGLTLSRRLAELLGGSLSVSSREGEGSVFRFCVTTGELINVNFVSELTASFLSQDMVMPQVTDSRKYDGSVLIVEDTPSLADLISLYVRRLGANCTVACNGKEGVDAALTGDFNLVLMDMNMPVMGGEEAVELLRSAGYTVPIVAMTANAMPGDLERYLEAGCVDSIIKPIDRTRFADVVSKYLVVIDSDSAPAIESTLLDHEPDILDLIQDFVGTLPNVMNQLRQAFLESDWKRVGDMAHSLKGSGGCFGYPQLTELFESIEASIVDQNFQQIGVLLDELSLLCSRISRGITY